MPHFICPINIISSKGQCVNCFQKMEFAMVVAKGQYRASIHFYKLLLIGIIVGTVQCNDYQQLLFHLIPEELKPAFESYSCKL